MERDIDLDYYRGFAILTVLFVHCIYWVGLLTSNGATIAKSYLLLEMPLLFLITGAGNTLSEKSRRLGALYLIRLQRVLIPYWVYALICVFIIQISITFLHTPGDIPYKSWFITLDFKMDLWSNIPYLIYHLWFVPVYILMILVIPLLKYLYNKLIGKQKIIPVIVIMLVLIYLDKFRFEYGILYYFIKNVVFYSFRIYVGLFYKEYKKKPLKSWVFLLISIIAYIILYLLTRKAYNIDMQLNKFPPNFAFFTLSIGNISIFLLIKKYIFLLFDRFHLRGVLVGFGTYSYTVFLYQPFAFLTGGVILDLLNISLINHDALGVIYYLLINMICALIFINLFGKIESVKLTLKRK